MKYKYIFLFLFSFSLIMTACSDEPLVKGSENLEEDSYYEEFKDGYSLAFDVTLDRLGGEFATRESNWTDYELIEAENYINPEEFRILFFNENDEFLFESKSRWLTEIDAKEGNKRWRVGVPVFQYLSDDYVAGDEGIKLEDQVMENPDERNPSAYNWDGIVDYMRNNKFKIAILANRPTRIKIPNLSDWPEDEEGDDTWEKLKVEEADNGPFWYPRNSVLTPGVNPDSIQTVFKLHHCMYDPLYMSKSYGSNNGGWYDFIMDMNHTMLGRNVPWMGAMVSWVDDELVTVLNKEKNDAVQTQSQYRLTIPKDGGEPQYIPMYGIQVFEPLKDWTKGTTYNISTQTASQATDYKYKTIFLLRSVVKLELRIPMFDQQGNYVDLDIVNGQIWFNNTMSRCEPMDVWTPTDEIWETDHINNCEWKTIRQYGAFADGSTTNENKAAFQRRLSWYYGIWKKSGKWDFGDVDVVSEEEGGEYPRIFNPLTQRLKCAYMQKCYLPIGNYLDEEGHPLKDENGKYIVDKNAYHRWVLYCGERNVNDPSSLGTLHGTTYCSYFRIRRWDNDDPNHNNNGTIYSIPITDYSKSGNPAINTLTGDTKHITNISEGQTYMNTYCNAIRDYRTGLNNNVELLPYPLIRNHFYRLTVSFGDNGNINVEMMDAQERNSDLIIFK